MNANTAKKVYTEKNHTLTETTPEKITDEYDFNYIGQFMEGWARDAVYNWCKPKFDGEDTFLHEYLKIAHHDLVVIAK